VNREDLITEIVRTVMDLNQKLQESLTLGRPGDVMDYARALSDACSAYSYLETEDE
jgi:hypothetical protein